MKHNEEIFPDCQAHMQSAFLQNCVFHLLNDLSNLIMLSATIEVLSAPFNTFYQIHFTQSCIFLPEVVQKSLQIGPLRG